MTSIVVSLIIASALIIAYQDITTRWINLWLTILFCLFNTIYSSRNGWQELLQNICFCVAYFTLNFAIIKAYYRVKEKRYTPLINSKFGSGDILIILGVGANFSPIICVYFFTICFVISLACMPIVNKTHKTAPLAGFILIQYVLYLFLFDLRLNFVH